MCCISHAVHVYWQRDLQSSGNGTHTLNANGYMVCICLQNNIDVDMDVVMDAKVDVDVDASVDVKVDQCC